MSEQRNRDRDHLLSDILAEPGEAGEVRNPLLDHTLRHVRRRRAVRNVRRAGSVLLLLVLPLVLFLWRGNLSHGPAPGNRPMPYTLVRTEPLSPSALIATQPFDSSGLIATTASGPNVVSVSTHTENPPYREIDDATLLALTGTNAAVLVRLGPHSAELVFASETALARAAE